MDDKQPVRKQAVLLYSAPEMDNFMNEIVARFLHKKAAPFAAALLEPSLCQFRIPVCFKLIKT